MIKPGNGKPPTHEYHIFSHETLKQLNCQRSSHFLSCMLHLSTIKAWGVPWSTKLHLACHNLATVLDDKPPSRILPTIDTSESWTYHDISSHYLSALTWGAPIIYGGSTVMHRHVFSLTKTSADRVAVPVGNSEWQWAVPMERTNLWNSMTHDSGKSGYPVSSELELMNVIESSTTSCLTNQHGYSKFCDVLFMALAGNQHDPRSVAT